MDELSVSNVGLRIACHPSSYSLRAKLLLCAKPLAPESLRENSRKLEPDRNFIRPKSRTRIGQ